MSVGEKLCSQCKNWVYPRLAHMDGFGFFYECPECFEVLKMNVMKPSGAEYRDADNNTMTYWGDRNEQMFFLW